MTITRRDDPAVNSAADGERRTPSPADRTRWPLLVLLVLVTFSYLLTLREGQPWMDDFALYILHARNLVAGQPYADTGFLYNPLAAWYSPPAYPPGFSLLLAPMYAAFGLNFFALRLVVLASAVAAVAVFFLLIRPLLSMRNALAVSAAFALQPFVLRFKNLLLPDLTFVFFLLVALWLIRRLQEQDSRDPHPVIALLAGACLYAAFAVRTIGVALFGALLLYYVLHRTRPSKPILLAAAVALALCAAQVALMPGGTGYAAQIADLRALSANPQRDAGATASTESSVENRKDGPSVKKQVKRLSRAPQRFYRETAALWVWRGDYGTPGLHGFERVVVGYLMAITALVAFVGLIVRLRRPTIIETFVISYVSLIMVWGFASPRYLIPLIPFFFFHIACGLNFFVQRGRLVGRIAALVVVVSIGVSYLVNLPRTPRSAYGGVTGKDAHAVFDFIRRCTPPDARFMTVWPRALTLFTGRAATRVPRRPARIAHTLKEMEIDYLMAGPELPRRDSAFATLLATDPRAMLIFESRERTVYRFARASTFDAWSGPPSCRAFTPATSQ